MTLSFEEWKKLKQEKGEWLPEEEYIKLKRLQRFEEWKKLKQEKGEWLPREEYIESRKRKREESKVELKSHDLLIKKIKLDIKREVIFDTETTGISNKDKIVEISFIEVIDGIKTGRSYQSFFNPLIKISKGAYEVHKITNEDVKNAPLFREKAEEIIKFIGSSNLVAHNAKFDMGMINRELINSGWQPYPGDRFIDTLKIARYLFPNHKRHKLDTLCQKFEVDNSNRISSKRHSAHEDTILLYHVYCQMNKLLKEQNLSPYDFLMN